MSDKPPVTAPVSVFDAQEFERDLAAAPDRSSAPELSFELSVQIDGLIRFLSPAAGSELARVTPAKDWSRELRIVYSSLLNSSETAFALSIAAGDDLDLADELFRKGLIELSSELKNGIVLSNGLMRSAPLRFDEWNAFRHGLLERLTQVDLTPLRVKYSDDLDTVPDALSRVLKDRAVSDDDRADLGEIVPRFVRLLRSLRLIGRALKDDVPLKPMLPVFYSVNSQARDLIRFINNRLARHPDEQTELYGLLDGTSYTMSLELKKAFEQELAGVIDIRPTPAVYAKFETSYELLNDSFRHILAGFARMGEPGIDIADLFPEFKTKLQRSLTLREALWNSLRLVKAAEQDPSETILKDLRGSLEVFLAEPVSFLFFKDQETVERFCEEVLSTNEKKDLVPVLHRFAAYLETLLGQVNMRAVLAAHTFQPDS